MHLTKLGEENIAKLIRSIGMRLHRLLVTNSLDCIWIGDIQKLLVDLVEGSQFVEDLFRDFDKAKNGNGLYLTQSKDDGKTDPSVN